MNEKHVARAKVFFFFEKYNPFTSENFIQAMNKYILEKNRSESGGAWSTKLKLNIAQFMIKLAGKLFYVSLQDYKKKALHRSKTMLVELQRFEARV